MPNKLKYSQKLAEEIAALIEGGNHTINEICSLSGITKKTFFKWKRERLLFQDLIKRSEDSKLEKITVEAKRSLLKLIRGFDDVETSVKTIKLKNGTERRIMTFTTKHTPANTAAIIFTLINCDPDNWKSGKRLEMSNRRAWEQFNKRLRLGTTRARNVRNKAN